MLRFPCHFYIMKHDSRYTLQKRNFKKVKKALYQGNKSYLLYKKNFNLVDPVFD